jgi:hypothetical protein
MCVLEVDVGAWPEKAPISLRQTGGSCARPGTHGFDRKLPDPKAEIPALRPLVGLEQYKNLV